MSMFFSGPDDDEVYAEDQKDRGMFNRESRDEWQKRRDRARAIVSGEERHSFFKDPDEELLREVKRLQDG